MPVTRGVGRAEHAILAHLLVVVLAGAALVGVSAAADAAPPTAEPQRCTLRPSAHRSTMHEWAGCLYVSAELARSPALGETAKLSVKVKAAVARPRTTITVELPSGLEFVSAPDKSTMRTVQQSDGTGSATLLTRIAGLTAGGTHRFAVNVRATAPGPAQIRVRAAAPVPRLSAENIDAGSDDVFVTIGAAGAASKLGGGEPATTGGVAAVAGTPAPKNLGRPYKAVASGELTGPPEKRAAPLWCVSGQWSYRDAAGTLRPSVNYQVQMWDFDGSTGDDLIGTFYTDGTGSFNKCSAQIDEEGPNAQEVYLRFISSNPNWRVRNNATQDDDYVNITNTVAVCDTCEVSFGSKIPSNDVHRALHAYDAANDLFTWQPYACWDRTGPCRQAVINWTPNSTDGTYYSVDDNDIHLAGDDPNTAMAVVHELTHSVMDDVYEDDFPPMLNCNPHFVQSASSAGCAWVEGLAEWVPAAVYNDPVFRTPQDQVNLETPSWGTPSWDTGPDVEGRVAGALLDIDDPANELYWDRRSEVTPGNVWTTFQNHVIDNFAQFWFARALDGYEVSDEFSRASLYQNTIDFSFRDPLTSGLQRTRPQPTPPHNFRFDTTNRFWSAVALRYPTANYDLELYNNSSMNTLLGASSQAAQTVDFVAVDSNHRAIGAYYPRVLLGPGPGQLNAYSLELAAGASLVQPGGTYPVAMNAGDIVTVRDVTLTAGVPIVFHLEPGNSSQDAELFLMDSDPAQSATFVRTRAQAVRAGTSAGPGQQEQFFYTPTTTDRYGIVIVNKAGAGTYTLRLATDEG